MFEPKFKKIISLFILFITIIAIFYFNNKEYINTFSINSNEPCKLDSFLINNEQGSDNCEKDNCDCKNEELNTFIENIFLVKSKAILNQDLDCICCLYDTSTKYGQWAYEYEERKVKYINNWAEKQGVKFIDISPTIVISKNSKVKDDKATFSIFCNTAYKYAYMDDPSVENISRIGTYHCISLSKNNGEWIITKEWYKDPFADSLCLDNIKAGSIREYIATQEYRDLSNIDERRKDAIKYAKEYCGVSENKEEFYKYNKEYKNFNSDGGDCANFASQILHEGGKFKYTGAWNYDKQKRCATTPWVNADKFTNYMLYSGRASVIAKGSYNDVYKASYKLLPGDFVAYEKKGNITHISVVTGADSKGYSLVTCHNTDRNDVPWDLGWSDKNIRFWLIRVHF